MFGEISQFVLGFENAQGQPEIGMVALIVVGDPSVNIEEARASAKKRVSRKAQKKMQALLDRAESRVQ